MNRALSLKIATVLFLVVLLLVPLGMIRGLVDERAQRRDEVLADIARSSSGPQQVTGPLLVVPYVRTPRETGGGQESDDEIAPKREETGQLYFLPERLALDATVGTETRRRGVYSAVLYHAAGKFSGYFELPPHYGVGNTPADYRFGEPYLAVGIRDIRGIGNVPELRVGGRTLRFRPGTLDSPLKEGVHAPLQGVDFEAGGRIDFAFELALLGTSSFELTPAGRETTVEIQADWPHPSFMGNFLPVERSVDDSGFRARWATSFFATNMEQLLRDCVVGSRCDAFHAQTLGFSLLGRVDQYLKSDRALKYALLFVGLSFAGFFLFEVLRRIHVHPIQYGLVGLALAIFYLLLLSLSEHIGFGPAYAASALACLLLIGSYVCAILRSTRLGFVFTGGLGVLYAMLYAILDSEDYALLMGSVLVFALLSAVMVLTRRVDWTAVGAAP